ncbi:MAG: DUF4143 domain-containing protein [Spirochaetales bacterium]|nr:DUF4143 domain-containing protein [Spirochaetales bacterium]
MFFRDVTYDFKKLLNECPIVELSGPRQVGKTTLAAGEGESRRALYLDARSERDRSALREPELYLSRHLDRLVILDDAHRLPDILPVLRRLVGRARRRGMRGGGYLVVGLAPLARFNTRDGERDVARLELPPLSLSEAHHLLGETAPVWVRGGFPPSLLAVDDERSVRWREDLIQTYLERDVRLIAPRLAEGALGRCWKMLAHLHGASYNGAELARSLGIDVKTAGGYVDLFVEMRLLRRLPPWKDSGAGKRLVKTPRMYIRDSGLLHTLLGIDGEETLLSHPILGASWEGFVVENLLVSTRPGTHGYFYRASGGAEIDLLVVLPDRRRWAVEISTSLDPRPTRGFRSACRDVEPERMFIVYPGRETYRTVGGVTAIPLLDLTALIRAELV